MKLNLGIFNIMIFVIIYVIFNFLHCHIINIKPVLLFDAAISSFVRQHLPLR